MDPLFASPTGAWTPVSPKLARARLLTAGAVAPVPVVVGLVMLAAWWPAGIAILTLVAVGLGWVAWWAPRNARSWGWAEAPQTLAVTRGLMFRRFEQVPYGRIQLVEVEAGPIATRLGIARLEIRTASEHGATVISGLTASTAAELRERLLAASDPWSPGV